MDQPEAINQALAAEYPDARAELDFTSAYELLIATMLRRLAELVARWDAGVDLADTYAAGCATIGRQVRVHLDEQSPNSPTVEGRAVGVGANGELMVDVGGQVESFAAGDVVHLR